MIVKQRVTTRKSEVNLGFWKHSLSYSSWGTKVKGDSHRVTFLQQPCNHFCSVFMTPVNQAIYAYLSFMVAIFMSNYFRIDDEGLQLEHSFVFIVLTKHFNSITQPLFKHQSIAGSSCMYLILPPLTPFICPPYFRIMHAVHYTFLGK